MVRADIDRTYIYGIVPSGDAMRFDCTPVGEGGDGAYAVPYRDIAAVVSACPLTDYTALARDLLVRELTRHQQVVERVLHRFPVLPVKFGTVVDEDKVRSLLRLGYVDFRAALDALGDKVQVELVATWDLASVLEDVAREAPVAELKSRIGDDASAASIRDRIRLGEMVKQSLDRRRQELEQATLRRIAAYFSDLRRNPLLDDSFVLNLAVLLEKARQGAFDRALEELDQELEGRLTFRCVGPLPPYSFSTVEVRAVSRPEIEQARRLLKVGRRARVSDIKNAYYRLARRLHPDAQSGDGGNEGNFGRAKEASSLLISYCRAQLAGRADAPGAADDHQCSFEPAAIRDTLLITIRPLGGEAL